MTNVLTAFLYGREVASLLRDEKGCVWAQYSPDWLHAATESNGHQLSITLPLQEAQLNPDVVEPFIAGLLPDSIRHRQILADELGLTDDTSDFAFLSKLGKDCAGAVTIVPKGETPHTELKPTVEALTDQGLEQYLHSLPGRPLLIDEEGGILLSLAGVNDKAGVVATSKQIGIPRNGYPSTHIIKTDIPGLPGSIRVEHFCLKLSEACGQSVPHTEIRQAGTQVFMLMKRYDRKMVRDTNAKPTILRLHQEDFCQALGIRPSKKYERHGGPGWKDCFSLMTHTTNPLASSEIMLDRVILQYLIGNPDAHGKNYSLLYGRDGTIEVAPFYDLNNSAAYHDRFKNVKPLMAMSIGGNFNRDEIKVDNWVQFSADIGMSSNLVMSRLHHLSELSVVQAKALRANAAGTVADTTLLDIVVKDIAKRAAHAKEMAEEFTRRPKLR